MTAALLLQVPPVMEHLATGCDSFRPAPPDCGRRLGGGRPADQDAGPARGRRRGPGRPREEGRTAATPCDLTVVHPAPSRPALAPPIPASKLGFKPNSQTHLRIVSDVVQRGEPHVAHVHVFEGHAADRVPCLDARARLLAVQDLGGGARGESVRGRGSGAQQEAPCRDAQRRRRRGRPNLHPPRAPTRSSMTRCWLLPETVIRLK
jgi:hypothetical protein